MRSDAIMPDYMAHYITVSGSSSYLLLIRRHPSARKFLMASLVEDQSQPRDVNLNRSEAYLSVRRTGENNRFVQGDAGGSSSRVLQEDSSSSLLAWIRMVMGVVVSTIDQRV